MAQIITEIYQIIDNIDSFETRWITHTKYGSMIHNIYYEMQCWKQYKDM